MRPALRGSRRLPSTLLQALDASAYDLQVNLHADYSHCVIEYSAMCCWHVIACSQSCESAGWPFMPLITRAQDNAMATLTVAEAQLPHACSSVDPEVLLWLHSQAELEEASAGSSQLGVRKTSRNHNHGKRVPLPGEGSGC